MRVWELWFAEFPYEEDKTITKSRPVIILNVEPLEVLSVKVTSQQPRDKYDTPIVNWQYAGLKKESVARISKTIFLDKKNFTVKIGTLHDEDKVSILTKYTEYLKETT